MQLLFGNCLLELVQGDITRQELDAIVNAANSALAGGGGVDGAIHKAAGPSVMEETHRNFPLGCPTGDAVATSAGLLRAKYIFHAVGPVWRGGSRHEALQLAAAYRKCLDLAVQFQCRSIAFPALSTGAYGYPMDLAAEVAISTAAEFLRECGHPELIRFVLWDAGAYGAFARVLEKY